MKNLFFYFWKTKIVTIEELFYENVYCDVDKTSCCGHGPITNEKHCPNCGRKIIRQAK